MCLASCSFCEKVLLVVFRLLVRVQLVSLYTYTFVFVDGSMGANGSDLHFTLVVWVKPVSPYILL